MSWGTALVGELSVQDPQFRQWWAAHHVTSRGVGTKELHHPVAGTLSLDWDTLTASTDPDQQLIVWTAEPGTPSYEGLRFLASRAAGSRQPAPGTTGRPAAPSPDGGPAVRNGPGIRATPGSTPDVPRRAGGARSPATRAGAGRR